MSTERLTSKTSALELFTHIPRFRLLNLNTPVERLDRLSRAIPVRDDSEKTDRVLFWHTGGVLTLL